MSMTQSISSVSPSLRERFTGTTIALTIATAIALTLAVVFIATSGHTRSATLIAPSNTPYTPLIQYRGTGQPPTNLAKHLTQQALPTVGLLRAEHSYGATP